MNVLSTALGIGLLIEWAVIAYLGRTLTIDFSHGFAALTNILIVTGQKTATLNMWRPPIPWLAVTPIIGPAYRFGGPDGALRAAHVLMPGFLALAAWLSYLAYAKRYSTGAAVAAAALLAANPLALIFCPFALFDVFSILDNSAFLWAAISFAKRPTFRAWALLAACYAATLLSRYHMAVLGLLPAAFVFASARPWTPIAGLRSVLRTWVWLAPLAGGAAVVLLFAILPLFLIHAPPLRVFLGQALGFAAERSNWADAIYVRSLSRQLGPTLSVALAAGLTSWVVRRKATEHCLALGLLLPLAILSTIVSQRDERYMIFLLPLVYAAVAEGLDALGALLEPARWARWAPCVFAMMSAPWSESAASLRVIAKEPVLHTAIYRNLGERLDAAAAAGACVRVAPGWAVGTRKLEAISRGSPNILMGTTELQFLLRRPDPSPCSSVLMVVPKFRPELSPPGRWTGAEEFRVYLAPPAPLDPKRGRLVWRLLDSGIDEAVAAPGLQDIPL